MKSNILPFLLGVLIFTAPLAGCLFTEAPVTEEPVADDVINCPSGTYPSDTSDDCVETGSETIVSSNENQNSTTEQDGGDNESANETDNSSNETEQVTIPLPLAEQCLDSHQNLAMHIHPFLNISIRGSQVIIPSGMGIDSSACPEKMHLLHTHDDTGKLHIETYEEMTVNLTLFLEVWNISQIFSNELFPLFVDPSNVTVSVNGVTQNVEWHLIALLDGD